MDKRATGWVPDYPDIKDYTLASKAIRSELNQVQGTQIAGTLESQKGNILNLLQLIAEKSGTEINGIKELRKEIEESMSNEVNLLEVKLVELETLGGDNNKKRIEIFDIDRIPTQVFEIIIRNLFPKLEIKINTQKSTEQNIDSRLTKLIYPIVQVIAHIISPIAENNNIEKIVLEKGIKYFKNLIDFDEAEDTKNSSLSDCQTMSRWIDEHKFFKDLACLAILDVKQAFIEELESVNAADANKKPEIQKAEKELELYFDKALEAKDLPFKKVLEFDGKNDYLYVENFEWQPDQPVTVEFWAKVNKNEVQDSFVFTVGGQEVPNRFCLSLIRENGWLYWDYGNYSSGRIDMPLPYNYLDQWIHVSVVSEGKSGKFMGIYLNGVLVKSIQKSDGPTIALKGLWIGKFLQEFQKGKISEFRIWNKVCSSDEIQENMFKQLTGSEDGLVGYWAFDEGEGNKVADKTKFNNSGVLSGNPKPKWEDLNKSEDANVKRWVCKEKLAQTSASVPKTAFIMMHSLVSQEYSRAGNQETAEDQKTQSLQFPILRKYLHNIQKANLGDNSNEEDDSRHLIILPEYVDLSFWCSPVEDQGSLNSCTANAAIALMEYFQKKSFGKYIDGSRLFLYKATRNLMQIEGNVGTSIRSTMKAMALFGVPPEEYWPYQEDKVNEEPIPFCYAFAQNYQALKYFRLDAAGIQPNLLLAQIKAILVAGIPCVFGFTLYHSIYDYSNPRGHIPFPHKRDKAEGGHAVVAVGYDDYKQIKNADGDESKGALLIRNCWGTKWGEGGYGWLPYEYVLKGLTADWWSLLSSEWFDTEQFGLGGKDWTDNVGTPDGQNQS